MQSAVEEALCRPHRALDWQCKWCCPVMSLCGNALQGLYTCCLLLRSRAL